MTPDEAAFLRQIAHLWAQSGEIRAKFSDWLQDRDRPEWYVVRHYEPWLWWQRVKEGRGKVWLAVPWLPNPAVIPTVSNELAFPPQIFRRLLEANGVDVKSAG